MEIFPKRRGEINKISICCFPSLPSTVEWAWRLLFFLFPGKGWKEQSRRGGEVSGFVGGGEEKT